jgi:hypothetical protein
MAAPVSPVPGGPPASSAATGTAPATIAPGVTSYPSVTGARAPVAAGPAIDPVLDAIARRVARGQCILFLGSGAHSPAPDGSAFKYDRSKAPPRGGDLSQLLAQNSNYAQALPNEDTRRLARVAAYYESALGRPQLVADISQAVSQGKTPSPVLRAMAQLDFPLIITTNYDQLLEQALTAAGKPYDTCVYSPDDTAVTRDISGGLPSAANPFLLKIHGDINNPPSIVVTDDDYIQFVLRMGDKEQVNPVPLGVRFALKSWPTLFIGYSLNDYNLRVLFKTLRYRMDRASFPVSYAVDPKPDKIVVYFLSQGQQRQIIFVDQDVWAFVPSLYRLVKNAEMPG